MIRVVIADDEPKVGLLIKNLIDWESMGMVVAGVARNGLEALDLVKTEIPGILITDIRMPGHDGLELIKLAKEINSALEIIIISGYRHFDYARTAIKFGVSDYILKPVNQNQLTATLTALREKFERAAGTDFARANRAENSPDAAAQNEGWPIRKAKSFIRENYARPITLDEVSRAVGFNPSYFSWLFKKETGRNYLDFVAELRLNKAKELLRETQASVAEICEAVGYADVKRFSRAFRKLAGIGPREFRKLYS